MPSGKEVAQAALGACAYYVASNPISPIAPLVVATTPYMIEHPVKYGQCVERTIEYAAKTESRLIGGAVEGLAAYYIPDVKGIIHAVEHGVGK